MNYAKIYAQLIEKARCRNAATIAYYETHHVVPRAFAGTNAKENLVRLTARGHFVAHWLLFKIYGCASTARAFKLMTNVQQRQRGRAYEQARQKMSEAMRGDKNVAKRPEVREKLKAANTAPFFGVSRPDHSAMLKERKHWVGKNNFRYGKGEEQRGAKNAMAVALVATHPEFGLQNFCTQTAAAKFLGVSQAAIQQALSKKRRSKGWFFERVL